MIHNINDGVKLTHEPTGISVFCCIRHHGNSYNKAKIAAERYLRNKLKIMLYESPKNIDNKI